MLRSKARIHALLRLAAVAGALSLFASVVAGADVAKVAELVGAVGLAGLAVVLVPGAAAIVAETQGWKLAVQALGRDVSLLALLRVRVATEALAQTLPAGVVFAESAKPFLLARRCGLSLTDGITALVSRKYLLLVSQAAFVALVTALGFTALRRISVGALGAPGLEWVGVAAAGVLALAAVGLSAWLRQSSVAGRLFRLLTKVPVRALANLLAASERRFSATDASVSEFFRLGLASRVRPALWFGLGWLLESVETFVILRVLGAEVSFVEVASFEVLLTFAKHVVFVVPAGLGVQDVGYVAALSALGVPDAASVGAAFVLVKRTKELAWIALGYVLLGLEGRAVPAAAVAGTSSA